MMSGSIVYNSFPVCKKKFQINPSLALHHANCSCEKPVFKLSAVSGKNLSRRYQYFPFSTICSIRGLFSPLSGKMSSAIVFMQFMVIYGGSNLRDIYLG